MIALFALLVALVCGAGVLRLLAPRRQGMFFDSPGEFVLGLAASLAMGLGLASALHFVRVAFVPDMPGGPIVFETLLVIIGCVCAVMGVKLGRPPATTLTTPEPVDALPRIWRAALTFAPLPAIGVMIAAWLVHGTFEPHGGWDAWSFWNTRARFLFLGGSDWVNYYDPALTWAHPDYPMLMPLSLARLWNYVGDATPLAAVILAITFPVGSAMVLWGAIRAGNGVAAAAVAVFAFLGMPAVLDHVRLQISDAPVGFFMLASLAMMMHALLHPSEPLAGDSARAAAIRRYGRWIVAGFFAGCAAWTKREGSLFLVASTLGILAAIVTRPLGWRVLAAWFAGAAPMVAILMFFKIHYPVSAEIKSIAFSFAGLTDVARHKIVWTRTWVTLAAEIPAWGAMILAMFACAFAFGLDRARLRGPTTITAAVVLGVMVGGYYAVFLFTPYDTAWMVDFSISRLSLQLWPMFVLTGCSLFRVSDERPTST